MFFGMSVSKLRNKKKARERENNTTRKFYNMSQHDKWWWKCATHSLMPSRANGNKPGWMLEPSRTQFQKYKLTSAKLSILYMPFYQKNAVHTRPGFKYHTLEPEMPDRISGVCWLVQTGFGLGPALDIPYKQP